MFLPRLRELIHGKTRSSRRPSQRANRRVATRYRPGLEGMEDRTVLSFIAPVSYASSVSPVSMSTLFGTPAGYFDGEVETFPSKVTVRCRTGSVMWNRSLGSNMPMSRAR